MNYIFSEGAVSLIAQFEGFKNKPYLDLKSIPTIGYGSTTYNDGTKVTMKDQSIDREKACEMLLYHLNKIELPKINSCLIRSDLKQNQIDAIGCLSYNIGENGFCGSTLHDKIDSNATIEEIKMHWLEWDKVNHVESNGLLKRRTVEFNYYNK